MEELRWMEGTVLHSPAACSRKVLLDTENSEDGQVEKQMVFTEGSITGYRKS